MAKNSSEISHTLGLEVLKATKLVFEKRIGTQPIPTRNTKTIDHLRKHSFGPLEHVTILQVGTHSQEFLVGVVYDFMFRRGLSIGHLHRLEAAAEREQFRAVTVPFVFNLPPRIKGSLESFHLLRCIQLTELQQSETIQADYYYSSPILGGQTAINQGNAYAAEIYKNIKKISHMILSDMAADEYDDKYASSNFGTRCYMNLEQELIEQELKRVTARDCAIDLGCGTGRHTFLLGKYFNKVVGYDFSTGMIDKANDKKRKIIEQASLEQGEKEVARRVEFSVRDVELFPPPLDDNSVSFISASFGMGSFVEDLDIFLEKCKQLLKIDGHIFLSFYNKQAAHCLEPPPWRNNALSAQLDTGSDEVSVKLWEGTSFKIFCKSWTVDEILDRMRFHFNNVKVITIPKIAGVLPSDYPAADSSALAKELIEIERSLSGSTNFQHGAYIIGVGIRAERIDPALFFASERVDSQRQRSTLGTFPFDDTEDALELAGTTKGLLVRAEFGFTHEESRSPHGKPFVYILPHGGVRNKSFLDEKFGDDVEWTILTKKELEGMYGVKRERRPLRALRLNVSLLIDPNISIEQRILVPGFSRYVLCENPIVLRAYLVGNSKG
jgi:SAM-dependent methyltransferase